MQTTIFRSARRAAVLVASSLLVLSATACTGSEDATPDTALATSGDPSASLTPSQPSPSQPTTATAPTRAENAATALDAVSTYSAGLERAWKQAKNPAAAATARDDYVAEPGQLDGVSLNVSSATNSAETQSIVYICGTAGVGPNAGTSREAVVLTAGRTTSLGLDSPKGCEEPFRGLDGIDDIHLDLTQPLKDLEIAVVAGFDPEASPTQNVRLIGDNLNAVSQRDLGTITDRRVSTRGPGSSPYVYLCATNGVYSTARGIVIQPSAKTVAHSTTVRGSCDAAEKTLERTYAADFDEAARTTGQG